MIDECSCGTWALYCRFPYCPKGENDLNRGEKTMTTFKTFYDDAADAIRDANYIASMTKNPQVIAYVSGFGWTHYDPRNGAVPNGKPELLCFALGRIPLPLSEDGFDVLFSAIRAELGKQ
jgi:hypothetical protein